MTNVEAIETLIANYPDACYEQLREAVDAAIEALKAQDAAGDTINRQAAIDIVWEWFKKNGINGDRCLDGLRQLSSAQPELSTEIQEILDYLDTTLHPIVSPDNWYVYSELHDMISRLPSVQPEVIRCKDCRYYKEVTSIHGDCESADMWNSLFGEVTEVEAIEVHKDHYCGYAERRTDG